MGDVYSLVGALRSALAAVLFQHAGQALQDGGLELGIVRRAVQQLDRGDVHLDRGQGRGGQAVGLVEQIAQRRGGDLNGLIALGAAEADDVAG
jgi:hypothetical protein